MVQLLNAYLLITPFFPGLFLYLLNRMMLFLSMVQLLKEYSFSLFRCDLRARVWTY